MFKQILFLVLFLITLDKSLATYEVNFSNYDDIDQALIQNFQGFKKNLQQSSYYQNSQNTNLVMDFVMLLANKSKEQSVRRALDYLVKTGGPFGERKKGANEQEKGLLASACQIIIGLEPELARETYDHIRPIKERSARLQRHLAKVLEIQKKAVMGDFSQPFRGPLVLPNAAQNIPDALKSNLGVNVGWAVFKGLLLEAALFEEPSVKLNPRASWLNDVELFGFLMGVLPNIRGDYIDSLWTKDNHWMEAQHNYVQWWFPIQTVGVGDGLKAPRFLETTKAILGSNDNLREYVQQMMRVSFARKANFWGQYVNYKPDHTLELKKLPDVAGDTWEKNWIRNTHNYYRMTRFLSALRLFGLIPEQDALFDYLKRINKSIENVQGSFSFWQNAVS